MFDEKRGQVWVETVIYTLIGLAIIGLVLAFAKPAIDKKKDEIVIEQSLESMSLINSKISDVLSAQGNQRVIDLKIGKGSLNIDTDNDKIFRIVESSFEYSEEGIVIPVGALNVVTEDDQGWKVKIEKSYNLDIQYGDKTTGTHQISESPTSYKLVIENAGINAAGEVIIKIRIG